MIGEKLYAFHIQGSLDIRTFAHVVSILEDMFGGNLPYAAHTVSGVVRILFESFSNSREDIKVPNSVEEALNYLRSRYFQSKQISMDSVAAQKLLARHIALEQKMSVDPRDTLKTLGILYPEEVKEASEILDMEKVKVTEEEE